MNTVELLFDTGYVLSIILNQNSFVQRWANLLAEEVASKEILQVDTFSFAMSEEVSRKYLTDAIDTVNKFLNHKLFKYPTEQDFEDQDYYNQLHQTFERISGASWDQPTRFMCIAPKHVKLAVRHINRFCHRLELRPYQRLPYMRVEFDTAHRLPLHDEDYKLFEHTRLANKVYLDYSTLGKTLQECFLDNLDPSYAGLKLQHHYSANFVIQFENNPDYHEYEEWLLKHKIDPNTNGIGSIPLGHVTDKTALQNISDCCKIVKITLE